MSTKLLPCPKFLPTILAFVNFFVYRTRHLLWPEDDFTPDLRGKVLKRDELTYISDRGQVLPVRNSNCY